MCNSIFLGKKTIPKAKDGEEFEIMIKAVYRTDEDGVRKLDVEEVDGDAVVGPEEYEEESDCGCGETPSADDALRLFIIKTKKD